MFSQWKYLLSSQCNFIPRICHNSRVKETLKFLPPLQIFPPCSTLHAPHSTLHSIQQNGPPTPPPSLHSPTFSALTSAFVKSLLPLCLFQNSQFSAQTDSWDNFCQNQLVSLKIKTNQHRFHLDVNPCQGPCLAGPWNLNVDQSGTGVDYPQIRTQCLTPPGHPALASWYTMPPCRLDDHASTTTLASNSCHPTIETNIWNMSLIN